MLNRKIVYSLFIATILCFPPLPAFGKLEISNDIAVYSEYVWRGFKLDDDPILQSGLYVSGYGFDLSVWGSADLENGGSLNADEADYSFSYTYSLKEKLNLPLSVSGGYIYYDFPSVDANSQEIFIEIAWNNILSSVFTWYHDFEDESQGGGRGDYVVVELNRSVNIENSPVRLDLSIHTGYNHKLFIEGEGGDVGCGMGLTFSLSDKCSFSPCIKYSVPFGSLRDSDDGNQSDEFYGGAIFTLVL